MPRLRNVLCTVLCSLIRFGIAYEILQVLRTYFIYRGIRNIDDQPPNSDDSYQQWDSRDGYYRSAPRMRNRQIRRPRNTQTRSAQTGNMQSGGSGDTGGTEGNMY
jgi:hypothetical protein